MAWPVLTTALLVTEVRTLLEEPVARRVSDAEIETWIDKAVALFMKDCLNLQGVATFALSTSIGKYAFATTGVDDSVNISNVIYMDGTSATVPGEAGYSLQKMHTRNFSNIQESTPALPIEYVVFKDDFYVWPLPSVSANLNLIMIQYYKAINGASGLSAIDFLTLMPAQYHQYVIWYAYAQALMKSGKAPQSVQYMSIFDNVLDFHRRRDNLPVGVDSNDMMNLPDKTEFVNQ